MSITTPMTAEQLLRMPDDGYRYELIEGEVRRMTPAGGQHGSIGGDLQGCIWHHVRKHDLGRVLLAETGFLIARDPDTVRAPDIAFVRKDRVAAVIPEKGFCLGVPDLAVEVVSPDDKLPDVDEKAQAWLAAGTRLVWVVNPQRRIVTVYRSGAEVTTLTETDDLDGQDVLLGFRLHVSDVFDIA